ncbi:erythromycin esterase [Halobacteriales archaeon QS_1_68_20]|nr:MAG: erythromycin esterase [Halobacteriales archaeon QS_1_68_20]
MREDVVSALADHAAPMASTDPDGDRDDLAPLADRLEDADVVGLGEATHGTRECFQSKHRIIRLLVADLGFRTVAFEADVAGMLAADRYVRGGDGDPRTALAGLDTWQLRTEAVCDLLRWLREFNEGRPPDDQVRVRGVDLSDPSVPAEPLRALLRYADVVPVPNDLGVLAASDGPPDDEASRARYLSRAKTAATAVGKRLDADRESFVEETSAEPYALTRHLARVVVRNCEWHRVRHEHDGPHEAGMAERDRHVAANVEWCLEQDPGTGAAVWAHDGHVKRGTFDDGRPWTDAETMGEHLDRELGDSYYPLGFDFGRGSFRAMDGSDPDATEPRTFTVGDPPARTATAHFDALDSPAFVDLASVGDDSRLSGWFEEKPGVRHVGSVYDPDAEAGTYVQRTDLPASFDWLVFLGESTPTRPADGDPVTTN